jgi:hypothetical protein
MIRDINIRPCIIFRCNKINCPFVLVKLLSWSLYIQCSWISATSAFPSARCWHKVAVAALLWCRLIWTNFMVCVFFVSFFHFTSGGVCLHPFLHSSFPLVRSGFLRRGPLICRGRFDAKRNFLFCLYCSSLVIWGSGYIIPLPLRDRFWGCCV